jgi:hypothetical protein
MILTPLRKMRFGFPIIIIIITVSLPMSGCESFRIHDKGRLKIAQEIVPAASELTSFGGAIFVPMEENLDAIKATQIKLRELTNAHEYESFKAVLGQLTHNEIAEKLLSAMRDRNKAFADYAAIEKEAKNSVNDALNNQELVSKAIKGDLDAEILKLKEAAKKENDDAKVERLNTQIAALKSLLEAEKGQNEGRTLEQTLKRTENWLSWIDKGLQQFNKAQDKLDGFSESKLGGKLSEVLGSMTGDLNENAKILDHFVKDAQGALKEVKKDEPLQTAKNLLRVTIEETAAAEQERLLELRRHLSKVKRLGDRLRARDAISGPNLYNTALGNIYFVVDSSRKADFVKVTNSLCASGRYATERGKCLLENTLTGIETDPLLENQWKDGTLGSFVANTLARAKNAVELRDKTIKDPQKSPAEKDKAEKEAETAITGARSSVEFVGAIGILIFHERRMVEDARLELAREQHRHSIRLSQINAGQRAQIVHQLAQGLAIYYEGGVKPAEVAQLLLLGLQVGGIFFIGSQI